MMHLGGMLAQEEFQKELILVSNISKQFWAGSEILRLVSIIKDFYMIYHCYLFDVGPKLVIEFKCSEFWNSTAATF